MRLTDQHALELIEEILAEHRFDHPERSRQVRDRSLFIPGFGTEEIWVG